MLAGVRLATALEPSRCFTCRSIRLLSTPGRTREQTQVASEPGGCFAALILKAFWLSP
jgi:hypothetical protein